MRYIGHKYIVTTCKEGKLCCKIGFTLIKIGNEFGHVGGSDMWATDSQIKKIIYNGFLQFVIYS